MRKRRLQCSASGNGYLLPMKRKVGLALGGGAARGLAHIGVLKALDELGIEVSLVAGASVGSVIGAAVCAGLSWRDILNEAHRIRWADLAALSLSRIGLMRLDGLERYVDARLGRRSIEGLQKPFAAVASDLLTGEQVILDSGPVGRAVRASCSVPGLFEPVVIDGRYLVDGGLVSDVPAAAARRMGAQTVIGVTLNAQAVRGRPPRSIVDVLSQSFDVMRSVDSRRSAEDADVLIAPSLTGFAYRDLRRVDELVRLGEEAALRALSRSASRQVAGVNR